MQHKMNYESPSNILQTPTGEMKTDKEVSNALIDHYSNVSK